MKTTEPLRGAVGVKLSVLWLRKNMDSDLFSLIITYKTATPLLNPGLLLSVKMDCEKSVCLPLKHTHTHTPQSHQPP